MPSVELRVHVSGVPHSFLIVTGPDGVEHGYGFAPLNHLELQGPGSIHDDTLSPYDSTTGKIELLNEDYNKLVDYISRSIDNPPPYDFFFGSQCADWATKGLIEAGIPAIAWPNLFPDNLLQDLAETLVWNPYTQ